MNYFSPDLVDDSFIPLSTSITNPEFIIQNESIPLDVCRTLKITADGPFSIILSLKDFYGNPMTCYGDAEDIDDVYTFVTARGASAIVSVKVKADDSLTEISIATVNGIELPYSNYESSTLMTVNYDDLPLLNTSTEIATPYFAQFSIDSILNSTQEQLPNEGRPRPIILIDDINFNGEHILYVEQSTQGFGFNNPPLPYDNTKIEQNDTYLNNFLSVFGAPSFNLFNYGWQS